MLIQSITTKCCGHYIVQLQLLPEFYIVEKCQTTFRLELKDLGKDLYRYFYNQQCICKACVVTSVYKQFTHVWVQFCLLRLTEGHVQMFKHLHPPCTIKRLYITLIVFPVHSLLFFTSVSLLSYSNTNWEIPSKRP